MRLGPWATILELPELPFSATTVDVPALVGHAEVAASIAYVV